MRQAVLSVVGSSQRIAEEEAHNSNRILVVGLDLDIELGL
jgi:hypothetical protein